MSWITIKTTGSRWEAEWMQQLLAAHEVPARIVSHGVAHLGCGGAAAVQVRPQDRWTALLLLSPIEEHIEENIEETPDRPLESG